MLFWILSSLSATRGVHTPKGGDAAPLDGFGAWSGSTGSRCVSCTRGTLAAAARIQVADRPSFFFLARVVSDLRRLCCVLDRLDAVVQGMEDAYVTRDGMRLDRRTVFLFVSFRLYLLFLGPPRLVTWFFRLFDLVNALVFPGLVWARPPVVPFDGYLSYLSFPFLSPVFYPHARLSSLSFPSSVSFHASPADEPCLGTTSCRMRRPSTTLSLSPS